MSRRPVRVYIGLGSNRDDPAAQLARALAALDRLPHSVLGPVSAFYRSAPVGRRAQSPFVNAVAALETTLAPMALLRALARIEVAHGRRRGRRRWGPRPLDLDLLLYGARRIRTARLTVPHPRLLQRAFVLQPLCAIAPPPRLPPPHRARLKARLGRMRAQRVVPLDRSECLPTARRSGAAGTSGQARESTAA
ncbi:MAG: 2-amino-4-hydroxy-6-hydroxymethyldihydropteridine diphosphokinase [Pseudomonadota bacterium]|nr:2-amino-4-hydroxy-6-hydroxymethyldihydropteridine diphosphokinase [Candidatus Acidoferrales bacterium]